MQFSIVRNDITTMSVDAIVNAANDSLEMGGGVCGAIFNAAGIDKLQKECDSIGICNVGQAVITKGYNLKAKHIIHTVGPMWQGGNNNELNELEECYRNSLLLAKKNNLKSIAFPLISSGIFGYPKDKALKVATSTIGKFIKHNDIKVYLVVYDKQSFVLSEKLSSSVKKYIDDNYVDSRKIMSNRREISKNIFRKEEQDEYIDYQTYEEVSKPKVSKKRNLKDVIDEIDESFSKMLLRLVDEKEMTDVETYKRANISRKLFSKIRGNEYYRPKKITAIAFAIALELSLDETKDLLLKAGYALSNSYQFDLIIEYFITENNYNVYEINEVMFKYDQPLLGV